MSKIILDLSKVILIVPFVLTVLLVANVKCLAQNKKTLQYYENEKATIKILNKERQSVLDQFKKLFQLRKDVSNIASYMQDVNEKQRLRDLATCLKTAELNLYSSIYILNLYSDVLLDCEPSSKMKGTVRSALDLGESYELDLERINLILSDTKNPTVVSQCNQAKTEIRNCIEMLERISELFK